MKSPKKILIVLCLTLGLSLYSQDFNKKFAVTIFNSTWAWTQGDGGNIGINLQYQHPIVYAGADVFYYPDLRGYTYTHIIGTVGFNFNFKNKFKEPIVRLFTGFRSGFIHRDNLSHPLLGFETGLQINLTKTIFIGGRYAYDKCGDSKVWSNDDYQYRDSGYVELGFRF